MSRTCFHCTYICLNYKHKSVLYIESYERRRKTKSTLAVISILSTNWVKVAPLPNSSSYSSEIQHPPFTAAYAADVFTWVELLRVDFLRSRLRLSEPLDSRELGDYFGHGWAIIGVLRPAPLYDSPEFVGQTPSQRRMRRSVWSLPLLVFLIHSPIIFDVVKRNAICENLQNINFTNYISQRKTAGPQCIGTQRQTHLSLYCDNADYIYPPSTQALASALVSRNSYQCLKLNP